MTTREEAMQWWNSFEASTQQSLCFEHYKERQFDTLTKREIEFIWEKEFRPQKLYSKQYDSYCIWNGSAYENDGKVSGAYFYSLEKAKNNGFEPVFDKDYFIPIKWESYKRIHVKASNLQEATEKALKLFLDEPDDLYLDDSFEIDKYIQEETGEKFDEQITINKVITL